MYSCANKIITINNLNSKYSEKKNLKKKNVYAYRLKSARISASPE